MQGHWEWVFLIVIGAIGLELELGLRRIKQRLDQTNHLLTLLSQKFGAE
jgi:hypothetical protein